MLIETSPWTLYLVCIKCKYLLCQYAMKSFAISKYVSLRNI